MLNLRVILEVESLKQERGDHIRRPRVGLSTLWRDKRPFTRPQGGALLQHIHDD